MSRRSSIDKLPPAFRQMIKQRLYQGGFSDYQGLADELNGMGYAVSKSALHRYGKRFESLVGQREAEAVISAAGAIEGKPEGKGKDGDDLNALNGGLNVFKRGLEGGGHDC